MWRQKLLRGLRSVQVWNTTWHQRKVSQAVNGYVAACWAAPARWQGRRRFSGHLDQIAPKQFGRYRSACLQQTAARREKSGQKSPIHFSGKWGLTRTDTRGRPTATPTKTTTYTFVSAELQTMGRCGTRSTAQGVQSRPAPSWRLNLILSGMTAPHPPSPARQG